MNSLLTKLKKIWRLIILRRKVFGTYGKNNEFAWSIYINEAAKIGNENYIGPYTMINFAEIGNYCSIGPGVKIGQGDHNVDFITTYFKISNKITNDKLMKKPAIVGNDVWIGANAVIMQGVNVGNGAVIGANAVVTKNVPDYAIVAGVPAKILRYRFSEKNISIINKSNWYKYEINRACELIQSIELNES